MTSHCVSCFCLIYMSLYPRLVSTVSVTTKYLGSFIYFLNCHIELLNNVQFMENAKVHGFWVKFGNIKTPKTLN